MDILLQDIRYGFRKLFERPLFTAIAVISVALGIGANTAIFTLVNAVLFKPLPVDDPNRLVALYITEPQTEFPDSFSYPDYLDYRDQNDVFSDLVGHYGIPLNMSNNGRAEMIWGEMVTGNYFSGLGVHLAKGRGFLPDEDKTPGS